MQINKNTTIPTDNTVDFDIKQVNSSFSDAYITAKIEAIVLKAKVLDDESIPLVGINASTSNGIVTIAGQLQSQKAINSIIKRAQRIKGVKKIISRMTVIKNKS